MYPFHRFQKSKTRFQRREKNRQSFLTPTASLTKELENPSFCFLQKQTELFRIYSEKFTLFLIDYKNQRSIAQTRLNLSAKTFDKQLIPLSIKLRPGCIQMDAIFLKPDFFRTSFEVRQNFEIILVMPKIS